MVNNNRLALIRVVLGAGTTNVSETVIIDPSSLLVSGEFRNNINILRIVSDLSVCTVHLYYKADTNNHIITIPEGSFDLDFRDQNGLINPRTLGNNGKIVLTTTNIGLSLTNIRTLLIYLSKTNE